MRELETSVRNILLIDSDDAFSRALVKVLGTSYTLRRAADVRSGIGQLDNDGIDAILLNLDLPNSKSPGQGPRDLLTAVSDRAVGASVIVYSWDTRRETTMEVIRQGALDYFDQPLDIRALKFALERACRRTALVRDLAAAQRVAPPLPADELLGNSRAMAQVREMVRKAAGVLTPVLITGEAGTGKNLVARAIHRLSPRAGKPFVTFSPNGAAGAMFEAEIFGHEKGAFPGATQSHRGLLEEAKGGTIFLDEIGDLPLALQAKLLRVLRERMLERLGSDVPVPVDVRVICASGRNLEKMVEVGAFREDLYFRISLVKVHLPPLRERSEDVALLAENLLRQLARAHNRDVRGLTPGFLSALAGHNWPGNVRELQNVLERSLGQAKGAGQLGVEDLPPELRGVAASGQAMNASFHEAVRNFKRELVRLALLRQGGNKLRTARELRISRCYLHRLLNQLKIDGAPGVEEASEEVRQQESAVVGG